MQSMSGSGIAAVGQSAFQIWSGIQQAQMIRRQTQLNQQIAEQNAQYLEQDAWEAEKMGYTKQARYQSVIAQTIGQQKAIYASQEVDASSGTAAAMIAENELNGFLNTLDIQQAARAQAKGLKIQASNTRLQGFMGRAQGEINASAATLSGYMSAGQTGLSAYQYANPPASKQGFKVTENSKPSSNGAPSAPGGLRGYVVEPWTP